MASRPLGAYRDLFPVTKRLAYLNHAGVAPLSLPAAEAMRAVVEECLTWGAARYGRIVKRVERARASAARLLATEPVRVAFVKNTSEGISTVAEGFPWRSGDAVVVPEGEFPANVYPWLHLARRGVRTIRVPRRGGRLLFSDVEEAVRQPGVRMLALSSTAFETGDVADLARLGQLASERGLFFFVDAIQSLGWQPIIPEALGIHALAADGHKWLLGPEGAGILWLSGEALTKIEPVEVGWRSVENPLDFSTIRFKLRTDAARHEPGSHAVALLAGLGAAIDLLLDVGVERAGERALEVAERVREGASRRGFPILSSPTRAEQSPIVTLKPPGEPLHLAEVLASSGVAVAARGGGVRVSPHFYNDETDIERFFEALDAAIAAA